MISHIIKIQITLDDGNSISYDLKSEMIDNFKELHQIDLVSESYQLALQELLTKTSKLKFEECLKEKMDTKIKEKNELYKTLTDTLPKEREIL